MAKPIECPICGRVSSHQDVNVFERAQFSLKTLDGALNFEAVGDACNRCLRAMLLDVQKIFPKILDHGRLGSRLIWSGTEHMTTKKVTDVLPIKLQPQAATEEQPAQVAVAEPTGEQPAQAVAPAPVETVQPEVSEPKVSEKTNGATSKQRVKKEKE